MIRRTFHESPELALRIFGCESGLREDAKGDMHLTFVQDGITYGYSSGVAQIRYLPGRPDPKLMLKPYYNIKYARQLYDAHNFSPWTCYRKPGIQNPSRLSSL